MKQVIAILFLVFCLQALNAQEDTPDGFTRFYYPNGNVSAEGTITDGKPDAYWKNYYEDGTLKSEGNRLFFELDSIWKFYNPDGQLSSAINYRNDKKNGYSMNYEFYYTEDSVKIYFLASKELYYNGNREGVSYYYDISGYTKFIYNYVNDKRSGEGKEFDKNGNILTLFNYFNGYLIEALRINRFDDNGLKQGRWMEFYSNGNKKTEYFYFNGVLNGLYKEFDINGKLLLEKKYVNGELYVPKPEDEIKLKSEIKKSFFPSGEVQYEGAFVGETPVGIHKEYNLKGEVVIAKEYNVDGDLFGEGLFDANGNRTGKWKLYDEYLKYYFGEGNYKNGLKEGKWIYYYPDGTTELEGFYSEGKPDKDWLWQYPGGAKKREETFLYGKLEGPYVEYDSIGNVILKGEYFDDARIGLWLYQVGDITEQGEYDLGERNGIWKHYYSENGKVRFTGNYRNGDEDGTHKWFYPSGKLELSGDYRVGKKHKDWKKYNPDGSLYMTYTYRNDELVKIDGINLKKGNARKK
jgi:uncharacterized protein